MRRGFLVVAPTVALVGLIAFITLLAPWALARQPYAVPEEPIYFDHSIHVQNAGMDCMFCHRTAAQGVTAGYPDVQLCMACHIVVGAGQPEIEKVRQAWVEQRPIDWVRIHRMPDHVRFVHEAHITFFTRQENVAPSAVCATCHGDVAAMAKVEQVRSLKMGDCVDCHRQYSAPTDCTACHY